jgi:hypothetical protein
VHLPQPVIRLETGMHDVFQDRQTSEGRALGTSLRRRNRASSALREEGLYGGC